MARPVSGETLKTQRSRLLAFIRRRVKTVEDAEDLVQDVLVQYVSRWDAAEPIEQVTAWLFTVARNKIIDWYRKRKPDTRLQTAEEDEHGAGLLDILPSEHGNPEQLLDRREFREAFASALADLPKMQREVFIQSEFEQRSFKELSAQMGIPMNTLLSHKHRAVVALRDKLRNFYDDNED
jgi:RNA polymerase sigma factor (sigma-70 family)